MKKLEQRKVHREVLESAHPRGYKRQIGIWVLLNYRKSQHDVIYGEKYPTMSAAYPTYIKSTSYMEAGTTLHQGH